LNSILRSIYLCFRNDAVFEFFLIDNRLFVYDKNLQIYEDIETFSGTRSTKFGDIFTPEDIDYVENIVYLPKNNIIFNYVGTFNEYWQI